MVYTNKASVMTLFQIIESIDQLIRMLSQLVTMSFSSPVPPDTFYL